ncbi:MAG: NrdH-redoxin [Parcubacteria group bacterium CG08_land_8_20_14_0_20_48_21]|nr:MAG: NrdH-redoxin [Parcubacteria group bacterium CG2_30_48_51]PIS32927.1 MAG: NrdH-redoxin [Parcubacteria group bacterium CG08_land_8_20_14_0_20_48_21]PIW79176.1 MAG: NrdH-redoxin [Parcubacteria group bacterium CG_4_8_14_3_um_filter_48_16]PIY77823.1 MAG: NrdH-redoxin [Parcubacteria group bacterium CG_4_10_14_0_8_um_filter_48_154]PIZ77963.1 MAG: NrdH-redoxin [bacterium CG_4_10_14_0_2_um_filter_48_144]PJC39851.1 MAG: NrdH-redoxin [Parcubacteria group bacterium CG_4_9_14_0_2_um_filter_48_40]P
MQITIYSTPTCPYCKMAKAFFDEQKIAYENIDVSVDHPKTEEMIQKSGQMGVPVIDMDGEIIIGFDRAKIEAILKK